MSLEKRFIISHLNIPYFEFEQNKVLKLQFFRSLDQSKLFLLTGDVGVGKTEFARSLLGDLGSFEDLISFKVPCFEPEKIGMNRYLSELFYEVFDQKIKGFKRMNKDQKLATIVDELKNIDKTILMFIDDAHHIKNESLNQLCYVTRLSEGKFVPVLIGKKELCKHGRASIWRKEQSVCSLEIKGMKKEGPDYYRWICNKLWEGESPFSEKAVSMLLKASPTPLWLIHQISRIFSKVREDENFLSDEGVKSVLEGIQGERSIA